jgi:hypothetical protein
MSKLLLSFPIQINSLLSALKSNFFYKRELTHNKWKIVILYQISNLDILLKIYFRTLKQLYINNRYLLLNRGLRSIAWLV